MEQKLARIILENTRILMSNLKFRDVDVGV